MSEIHPHKRPIFFKHYHHSGNNEQDESRVSVCVCVCVLGETVIHHPCATGDVYNKEVSAYQIILVDAGGFHWLSHRRQIDSR